MFLLILLLFINKLIIIKIGQFEGCTVQLNLKTYTGKVFIKLNI